MTIFTDKFSYLNSFFRSIPFSIISYNLLIAIIFNNTLSKILTIGLLFSEIINYLLKKFIFKPFCKVLTISMECKRPENANNCGSFYDDNDSFSSTSEGMPSGHSQLTCFLVTFLMIYIWKNCRYFSNIKKIISSFVLITLLLYMGYTRIYVYECHTIEQVSVGYLIGILISIVYYKFVKKYLNIWT